jgi:GntR family transcriptional regulator/MocR family aminotransferase
MASDSQPAFLLSIIQLDETAETPLYQQLYSGLQQGILSHQLRPGLRLPSTRDLSGLFGVSRNTVLNAVEQLMAEGYLEARPRSGTYVSRQLPETFLETPAVLGQSDGRFTNRDNLSERGQRLGYTPSTVARPFFRHHAFSHGVPAVDVFPFATWARLVNKHYRQASRLLFDDSGRIVAGYEPLREAIAEYLQVARAVRCGPEQVIVVSGSQQALYLVAHLLLDPGDKVWVEEPGYVGARGAFRAAGAELVPVPVGKDGLDAATGIAVAQEAACAYVTPSHQFPLGKTMSVAARLKLLNWAAESGAWIIEDDYDSEYRYSGQPIPAMQGLDQRERVIYIGTFSKVLFPGLRLGYLVVPPALVEPFVTARRLMDVQSPVIPQAALADFIEQGHFARHLRRMRTLYGERLKLLVETADKHLNGRLQIETAEAGMHTVGWLPEGVDDEAAFAAAARHEVEVTPLSEYYLGDCPRPGLVMDFAATPEDEVLPGILRLRKALEEVG